MFNNADGSRPESLGDMLTRMYEEQEKTGLRPNEISAGLGLGIEREPEATDTPVISEIDQEREHAGLGRQIFEVVAPFQKMLDDYQMDAPTAIRAILADQQRLIYGSMESRLAAYKQLGQELGLAPSGEARLD